jgi:predicted acetyltransferase
VILWQADKVTSKLSLMEPNATWQAAFLAMAAEYAAAGDLRYQGAVTDFAGYLQRVADDAVGSRLPPGYVRQTTYWGVEGTRIVGGIRLRYDLTPMLCQLGGHVGYDIRPSMRGQGYGTLLLTLTLVRARQAGLTRVLITCDTANIASARVIEKNGGRLVYQGPIEGHAEPISHYLIDLPAEA